MIATGRTRGVRPQPPVEPIVLIVVPPFQGLKCPVLGPSQLKANLVANGIPAEVLYLNLLFADHIGPNMSEWLSGTGPYLVGEFLFSHVLHDFGEEEVRRFVDEVVAPSGLADDLLGYHPGRTLVEAMQDLVDEAREFIQGEAVREILARSPWLVGFSSTFQANCCSLATIRQLKRERPQVLTVMGGANCETVMGEELLRRYPDLDFVGRGECDKTFVEFISSLRTGGDGSGVTGFMARADAEPTPPSPPLHAQDLDTNSHPDFDDYFDMLERVSYRERIAPGLAIETSRGCWWGWVQHCTFCAFNREGMLFRSKQPQRVVAEIKSLVERYGITRMEVTDNILDMAYFRSLLPELAGEQVAEYFWETKANMTREQVRLLARARVNWIQPGIESLSDLTLKLMKKGSKGIQNIQLLKWGTESGIKVSWNWLFGFPGESEEEVDNLVRTVERIHHLQPPASSPVIFLERFSPYHTTPEEWGLDRVRAASAYYHVYPFPEETVENLAFFFECGFFTDKKNSRAYEKMKSLVARWRWAYPSSHLIAVPTRRSLWILDTRSIRKRRLHRLSGLRRRVYERLFRARGMRKFIKSFGVEATPEEVTAIVRSLIDDELVLELNDRYLALATDPRMAYRRFPEVFPGGQIVPRPKPTLGKRLVRSFSSIAAAREGARDFVMDRILALLARLPMRGEIGEEEDRQVSEPTPRSPAVASDATSLG